VEFGTVLLIIFQLKFDTQNLTCCAQLQVYFNSQFTFIFKLKSINLVALTTTTTMNGATNEQAICSCGE